MSSSHFRRLYLSWHLLPDLLSISICLAALMSLLTGHFQELSEGFAVCGLRPLSPGPAFAFLLSGLNIKVLFRPRLVWFQRASGIAFTICGLLLPMFSSFPLLLHSSILHFGVTGAEFHDPASRTVTAVSIGFALWGLGLLALYVKRINRASGLVAASCGSLVFTLGCTCLLDVWFGVSADQPGPIGWILHLSVGSACLFCLIGSTLCAAAAQRLHSGSKTQRSAVHATSRLLVALTLLLLFIGVNVTLALALEESTKTKVRLARTYQSVKSVEEMVAAISQAESGQRGYLLTDDSHYLKAYRNGLARWQSAHEARIPQAGEWAGTIVLNRLMQRKIAELAETIRLKQAGLQRDSIDLVRSGEGLNTMERIEEQASHIRFVFSSSISEQNSAYKQANILVRRTVVGSYVIAGLLLGCAALLFQKEIARRTVIETKLRAHEKELALRIEERTAELKASETRYRAMMDQSPVAVHVLDQHGNSLRVNPAFERMVGVSAEQMHDYNIWTDPQPAAQGTVGLLERAFAGETMMTGAIPHLASLSAGTPLAEGGVKPAWAEVIAYPVKGSSGEVQEVVLLCHDVTDRELALNSVRESEMKFRQLADLVPQLVWTAKPDGEWDYYNERWHSLVGSSPEEGSPWHPVVHPDDLPIFLDSWAKSVQTKTPFEKEQRLWDRQQGQYRWFLARSVPILDDMGQVKRWFGTTTDIHEQKAAEEILEEKVAARTEELQHSYELLQAREDELRRSLTERDILFREVHHRVKNNLQVISSLLRMQSNAMKNEPAAAVALEESRRRILSMSMIHERLYANRSVDRIDFAEYAQTLVKELIYSYSLPGRVVESRICVEQVHLNVDQAIPCGLILNELVTNALKYAFIGQETGEIYVSLQSINSNEISISVADTGMGLPEGFDWKKSTSLGLPIVEILSRQLDGCVEYEFLKGAKFTVKFPIRHSVDKAA